MQSAIILTPSSTGFSSILLSIRTRYNIPEGPEYEQNINTISMYGELFYQLHAPKKNITQMAAKNRQDSMTKTNTKHKLQKMIRKRSNALGRSVKELLLQGFNMLVDFFRKKNI